MKRTLSLSLAAASLIAQPILAVLVSFGAALASTRPRYGGTLRMQMRARVASLHPTEFPADPAQAAATERLALLVFDRLIALDEQGRPTPQLALSWQHDAAFQRWEFLLRPGVKFHDGAALTAALVAGFLRSLGENFLVNASSGMLVIQSSSPAPDLLLELARPRHFIFRSGSEGLLLGTGPFKLAEWQPQRKAVLTAFEEHWGGQPYVDAVEIEMGVNHRDQLIALEVGRADLVEILPGDVRRAAQGGRRVSSSAPVELMALLCVPGKPAAENPRIRESLALSVDRASIHSVLLQRQGELAGGLLPQWLSGYAFLFPVASDAPRARELWSQLAAPPRALRLDYDPADPLAQSISERIALNAREAGIPLQVAGLAAPSAAAQTDLRLVRVRLKYPGAMQTLADIVKLLGLEQPSNSASADQPEQVYAAERQLLETGGVIPLFHLPEIVGLSPRVKNWMPFRWGEWRLADVWLAPEVAAAPPAAKVPEKP